MPQSNIDNPTGYSGGRVHVGDRIQFVIPPAMPGQQAMAGEGFAIYEAGGLVFVAVLGLPQMLTIHAEHCRAVELGALVRRVALT